MGAETELKNWFRKRFKGWSDVHEPRNTMGQGFPDVSTLFKHPRSGEFYLVPIEFKVGEWKGSVLHVSGFEPAQVSWHYNFRKAGGFALIAVGVRIGKKDWALWKVDPGDWMREWRKGIPEAAMSPWLRWAP